ncbi:MAG: TPM domain-containing protein [Desulfovibrio sp.]
MTTARTFLSDADRERIITAVKDAEQLTSGEIVPLVTEQSAEYHAAEFNGALALGLALAIPATLLLGRQDMWSFLLIFCAVYALCFLAMRNCSFLKRLFTPKNVMEVAVGRACMTAFHSHGLHRTRDMTGILIYVSVFERRVCVLADKGINDKVAPSSWDKIISIVVQGIRNGNQGPALAEAVTRCGALLAGHFPVRDNDSDELPNLIVESDEI